MKNLFPYLIFLMLAGCRTTSEFHDVANYYDKGATEQARLNLPFDAFVVGIEKANNRRAGEVAECSPPQKTQNCLDIDAPYFVDHPEIRQNLKSKYRSPLRTTYVSHIAQFGGNDGPCFIYNLYSDAHGCGGRYVKQPAATLVDAGWPALDFLGVQLAAYIQENRPTHLVLYTMGWNTLQDEAMQNFRDLAGHLKDAGRGDAGFRPLIIGITWPSTGSPTIPASDFGIKAKDADEVGAVWENILINRVIRDIKTRADFKVVVIGHSFGARASSRAVFSRALVTSEPGKTVDLLIGLQGAYSFQRYGKSTPTERVSGIEGAPYRDFPAMAGMTVLTASTFDTAVTKAFHAEYFVGSSETLALSKTAQHSPPFSYDVTDNEGKLAAVNCDSQRILYIDASSIVKGGVPGSMAGAHSAIYTPEMGNLIFQLISACAK